MREVGTKSIPLPSFALPPRIDAQLEEGQRIGRYQLLVPLARGGMAEVWVARLLGDLGFSRIFALKTIRSEYASHASFREFFFEEARIAARLRHVNVVEVVDLGEEGPILFQVMTLVEGDSLANVLRAHLSRGDPNVPTGLPAPIAARILCDALAGLHAAHELTNDDGVALELVHRDVSPQNVLVGLDGVAKLADFGIAQVLGGVMEDRSGVVGKPGYVSPEQSEKRPLDRRSDIFTAGIVLWEVLTGRRLYQTGTSGATPVSALGAKVPDPREFAPDIAPGIAAVVMRALELPAEARFQTAAEMRDALEVASRESGALATSTDVARLVTDLSGHYVAEVQEAVRRTLRGEGLEDPLRDRPTELMTLSAVRLDPTVPPGVDDEERRTVANAALPSAQNRKGLLSALAAGFVLAAAGMSAVLHQQDEVTSEPLTAEVSGARPPSGLKTPGATPAEAVVEKVTPPPSTLALDGATLPPSTAQPSAKPAEKPTEKPAVKPPAPAKDPAVVKRARVPKPAQKVRPPRPKFTNPYAR